MSVLRSAVVLATMLCMVLLFPIIGYVIAEADPRVALFRNDEARRQMNAKCVFANDKRMRLADDTGTDFQSMLNAGNNLAVARNKCNIQSSARSAERCIDLVGGRNGVQLSQFAPGTAQEDIDAIMLGVDMCALQAIMTLITFNVLTTEFATIQHEIGQGNLSKVMEPPLSDRSESHAIPPVPNIEQMLLGVDPCMAMRLRSVSRIAVVLLIPNVIHDFWVVHQNALQSASASSSSSSPQTTAMNVTQQYATGLTTTYSLQHSAIPIMVRYFSQLYERREMAVKTISDSSVQKISVDKGAVDPIGAENSCGYLDAFAEHAEGGANAQFNINVPEFDIEQCSIERKRKRLAGEHDPSKQQELRWKIALQECRIAKTCGEPTTALIEKLRQASTLEQGIIADIAARIEPLSKEPKVINLLHTKAFALQSSAAFMRILPNLAKSVGVTPRQQLKHVATTSDIDDHFLDLSPERPFEPTRIATDFTDPIHILKIFMCMIYGISMVETSSTLIANASIFAVKIMSEKTPTVTQSCIYSYAIFNPWSPVRYTIQHKNHMRLIKCE